MEFHFRRHFRLRPKMKNAFRSASSIHHKKVLVLVLRCKVLNTRLGLGLEIKVLVLILVLKKVLITSLLLCIEIFCFHLFLLTRSFIINFTQNTMSRILRTAAFSVRIKIRILFFFNKLHIGLVLRIVHTVEPRLRSESARTRLNITRRLVLSLRRRRYFFLHRMAT